MAFDKTGQGYFIFNECDFDGALKDLINVINDLQDEVEQFMKDKNIADWDFDYLTYSDMNKKIDKYLKVALYMERLKRGQKYV
jgi:hypothetical protein